ncbi:hypothetical protein AB0M47_34705 [Hamadaea sp. NPDC051192]|uniref:hypothetical protein n=1 Tax=Hamadaea sp. NPDC051192 TaxID=3154940 RepID=UPI0034333042
MDDLLVREKLRTYVVEDEPPMTLTSVDLLKQGSRRRTFRFGAFSAVALVAATVAWFSLPSNEPQTVLSGEAPCLARVPLVTGATPDITVDPLAASSPLSAVDSATATRVSCYLVDAVAALTPDARYLPTTWRAAAPFQTVSASDHLLASARTPGGSFSVMITRATVAPPSGDATVTLPDGRQVAVDSYPDLLGPGARWLEVALWTGHTLITVGADNYRTVRPPTFGDEPILTQAQLIQLVTAPALALYG